MIYIQMGRFFGRWGGMGEFGWSIGVVLVVSWWWFIICFLVYIFVYFCVGCYWIDCINNSRRYYFSLNNKIYTLRVTDLG